MNLEDQLTHKYYQQDRLLAAVDCIIFGFDKNELKVLLIKRGFEPEKGKWSLVGGFLHRDESLNQAAHRILSHYTGLDQIYMEQVATYSEVDRDPGERTISTAFYALINLQEYSGKLHTAYNAQWFTLNEAPPLIFDHNSMVTHALQKLRDKAAYKPIGFELLPEKFTMPQLQKLYEAIWNTEFDKRNFINKINSFKILIKLDEKDFSTSRKGAYLYKFNAEEYEKQNASGRLMALKIQ
jgi:ADP-ribose pyrophosphatase YjhB (NUDIX family)